MHFVQLYRGRKIAGLSGWTAACVLTLGSVITVAQSAGLLVTDAQPQEDVVHMGDVVDIDVVGGFEFDWRGTITPEGYLDGYDAYAAPIAALCRTEKEIADEVAKALGRILREPKVTVRIVDRSKRAQARIDGAVRTPARFSIRRTIKLREIIVLAGGIVSGASGNITIVRPSKLSCRPATMPDPASDNGSEIFNITISDLLSGKASADPVVLSGDIITVSRAQPVYVIGAVNNPSPIYSTSQLTLSRAIATAGGLSKDARESGIKIFRRTGSESVAIEANLAKVRSGELEDEILKPFDIIDVPGKAGGKRRYPPSSPAAEIRDQLPAELPLKIIE